MSEEKSCLECKQHFPRTQMIRGSKNNPYGDKEIRGYLCQSCYRKRVERRSLILLGSAIISLFFGFLSLGIAVYTYWFVKSLLAEEFFRIIETFLLVGVVFLVIAAVMVYLRHRELLKMKKKFRSTQYASS